MQEKRQVRPRSHVGLVTKQPYQPEAQARKNAGKTPISASLARRARVQTAIPTRSASEEECRKNAKSGLTRASGSYSNSHTNPKRKRRISVDFFGDSGLYRPSIDSIRGIPGNRGRAAGFANRIRHSTMQRSGLVQCRSDDFHGRVSVQT